MTAADNLAIAARAGKAFTFTRKRGSATAEFFPGAGSTLHFANRDTDTFTARNLPAGLLLAGDEVTVAYGNTTVFKGEVDRIVDRHGRGTDRVQDVTVAGPWSKLNRLVFRQTWGVGNVAFSSSRVILGQTAAGLGQHMKAQLAEIAGYAATPCGISLASADNHAPEQYLPLDEARDITCADAIRRELRFFPKIVVRFDYSPATPALEIVDPEHADAASYAATIPKTDREYVYNAHPVKYVDVTVDAVEITVNGDSASFHQAYPTIPSGTSPLDILHVTVPLARGGGSTTNETFEIESEEIPGALNSVDWWKAKHPRLANVAASAISFASSPTRSPSNYGYIVKNTKDEIEAAGKHCEVSRFQCKVKISTTDDVEDEVLLTMDFLTTDARSGTYTVQTGSTATAGETLPAGLAQALYEQRSQSLVSESMTIRLGESFPKLGDKLTETVGSASETLYLQSFDVDVADLTARLSFGQPEHLSAEDMKSLLNGFRQRGSASTAKLREREGADEEDEPPAPGGIPPISSSEWSPGTKVKTTLKQIAGTRAGTTKSIFLDSTAIPQDCESGEIAVHKFTYLDKNGDEQEFHGLFCDDIDLRDLGKMIKEVEVEPSADAITVTLQYTDGSSDVIEIPTSEGLPGQDGQDGVAPEVTAEQDEHAVYIYVDGDLAATIPIPQPPEITAEKSGKTTTIYADGDPIATIEDGKDGADGDPGGGGSATGQETEVVTGATFRIYNGKLVATLSKSKVKVLAQPEAVAAAEVDVCDVADVTVVTSEGYSTSSHQFTNERATIKVLGSQAADGQTPFTATPLSGEG